MSPPPLSESKIDVDEENQKHIFALGICILFAWMFVVILCASPQLFRDLIKRYICCFWYRAENSDDKVKVAEAKLRRLSQQFLGTQMVATPSSIIISQAMGPNKFPMLNRHLITEPIIEEQRGASVTPSCVLEDETEVFLERKDNPHQTI